MTIFMVTLLYKDGSYLLYAGKELLAKNVLSINNFLGKLTYHPRKYPDRMVIARARI